MFRIISFLSLLLFANVSVAQSHDRVIDDGYTPSERFYRNSVDNPELVWPELVFEAGQKVLFDRRYKLIGSRELHLDIFLPAKQRASKQAIMLVHGGGWRSGNKSNFYPMANLLAQRGYTVFLPEYRLSPEALYPAGLVDLNDARVWIAEHAKDFGIAPDKIAIAGGSSGGHMAALLANTANKPWFKGENKAADTSFNLIVDLDGVLDFTDPLAIENENKLKEKSAAGLWFGGAMETTLPLWQQASTARHIDAHSPPMLIISSGLMRFTAGKDKVIQQLTKEGIANEYHQFADTIHTFWLFEPYMSQAVEWIDTFFTQQKL